MSTTLLRLGLWIMILVLALYVISETYADQPIAELIPTAMLQQALALAGVLLVAGVVFRIVGKGAQAVRKNRCQVCKTPVPPGAIFCRAHLRSVLAEEDEKTHMTRVRR
jgi:hypothetical protein